MIAKEIINHFFNFGSFQSYEYFGVHPMTKTMGEQKLKGFIFRLYAPNATEVFVVGDFNQWTAKDHPMKKVHDWVIY
jgi:1,4-alpha-glucan branching enzyme